MNDTTLYKYLSKEVDDICNKINIDKNILQSMLLDESLSDTVWRICLDKYKKEELTKKDLFTIESLIAYIKDYNYIINTPSLKNLYLYSYNSIDMVDIAKIILDNSHMIKNKEVDYYFEIVEGVYVSKTRSDIKIITNLIYRSINNINNKLI